MNDDMRAAIAAYDWSQHVWGPGRGGSNPDCVPEWKAYAARLLDRMDRLATLKVTDYGGWPRVGWGQVEAFEMRPTWPYQQAVPSILYTKWDGTHWIPLLSVAGMAEHTPGAKL